MYTETVEAVSYNPHIPGGRAYGARFAYGLRGKFTRYGAKKYRGTAAATYVVYNNILPLSGVAVNSCKCGERRFMGTKANDIRCDLILLDMKQKDLLALLWERGYCCSAGKLSDYILGRVQSEVGMRILSAARDILREKKAEREKL